MAEMFSQTMWVTPQQASAWLASSPGNRRLRKWWVTRLSTTMREGHWMLTHQGISFDEDGRLMDGHHRLEAVVQSDTPCLFLVVRNCKRESFEALDQGIKRTVSDLLSMDKRVAEPLRFAASLCFSRNVSATYEIRSVAETGLEVEIQHLVDFCGATRKIMSSAPVKLAAGVLLMEGQDGVDGAYKRLVSFDYDAMTSTEKAFTRQVMDGTASATKRLDLLARAARALNQKLPSVCKIQLRVGDDQAAANWVREVIRGRLAP